MDTGIGSQSNKLQRPAVQTSECAPIQEEFYQYNAMDIQTYCLESYIPPPPNTYCLESSQSLHIITTPAW